MRHYGEDHPETLNHVHNLDHPQTLRSMNNLGVLLMERGKVSEAEPLHRYLLERNERQLGVDHLDTLISVNNLGCLLTTQGKLT